MTEKSIKSYYLPTTAITRIAKSAVPGVALQKETKESLLRCSTLFISYLTSASLEFSKGKVLHVDEVKRALGVIDLESIRTKMEPFLLRYQEEMRSRKEIKLKTALSKSLETEDLTNDVSEIVELEEPVDLEDI